MEEKKVPDYNLWHLNYKKSYKSKVNIIHLHTYGSYFTWDFLLIEKKMKIAGFWLKLSEKTLKSYSFYMLNQL